MHIITCDILRTPFQKFFFFHRATKTQASCLDDVPVTVERYDFLKESQKPGEEYNAFEQCQQSFGPNFVPHVKPDEPPFEVKKIFFFSAATTTLNTSISTTSSSLWEFLHWRTLHEKLFNRVAIAFTMIPCLRLDAKSDKNRVKRSSRKIVPFGIWPFGFRLNFTLSKSSSKVGFKKVYVAIVRIRFFL